MNLLDVVIPVKNEAGNIKPLIERLHQVLTKHNQPYRVIFIDDHSTDQTHALIERMAKTYPVEVHKKIGKPGKAFSILQASKYVTSEFMAIIDGDLQYPPEALPEMLAKTDRYGVVIARRESRYEPISRQITSKIFRFVFGQMLFGLNYDIQSGLKLFKTNILKHIQPHEVTAWTLDLPLLYTAQELGYQIDEVVIKFAERRAGESKIKIFRAIKEIGGHSLQFKLKDKRPLLLSPNEENSMMGAGLIHNRKKFVTHTTLSHHEHALHTFVLWQRLAIAAVILLAIITFALNPLPTLIVSVAILSFIYFVDVFFNLSLISNSLHSPSEINFTREEIASVNDKDLPIYSILCPLYKESAVLPHFVQAIQKMDWPKEKLDVLLLLEEDDQETIAAAQAMDLPAFCRIVVVPNSEPKTKPKACNYGLAHAKGEYLVIYDAEDVPDPLQLKKAYLAFKKAPTNVKCLQAKLNYFNPNQNLLTRLFTIEYSLWFDITLPGLQSINTIIPLGGTSNHFPVGELQKLKGWDPFNVTEDCDLGVRLFKQGYQTAIIDSVTLEEANSSLPNWIRQRSRWIKGYMQTFLIHMRHPRAFFKAHGWHALIFQLLVGGKLSFMIINPIMWLLTISYFVLYQFVGEAIEQLYPGVVFLMALFSLVFGNFLFVYSYMIGAAKRRQWHLMKYVFLKPFYWLCVSIAAAIALYQLIIKPHYWEKTVHGLHLSGTGKVKPPTTPIAPNASIKPISSVSEPIPVEPDVVAFAPQMAVQPALKQTHTSEISAELPTDTAIPSLWQRFSTFISSPVVSGGLYVVALLITYGLNFLYNLFLGRTLSLPDFGTLSFIATFLYFGQIFFLSLSRTVTHHSAFLLGKYKVTLKHFWGNIQRNSLLIGLGCAGLWLLAIPTLTAVFHLKESWPLLAFTPVWLIGLMSSVDTGFLSGQLLFTKLAGILLIEASLKLIFAIGAMYFGYPELVYAALPLSMTIAFLLTRVTILVMPSSNKAIPAKLAHHFPQRFFWSSVLNRLSTLTFLGSDILLATYFLSKAEAGQYALLALVGKMIFFIGSLGTNFIISSVAKAEGQRSSSTTSIIKLMSVSLGITVVTSIFIGPLGGLTLPLLLGDRAAAILPFVTPYVIGVASYTIAITLVTYHQAKQNYLSSVVVFALTVLQILALSKWHESISTVVLVLQISGVTQLASVLSLQVFLPLLKRVGNFGLDFLWLFSQYKPFNANRERKLHFLLFNWRDTRHSWAGGAEVYIHEIAKQWVKHGHHVTVFCGNDGHSPRNEVVDGIQVIRRGGHFTVYFWAFVYYVTRLHGLFDVIIDCENGIPFFAPMYVKEPVFLLIFHVHQKIFRQHLPFPLSTIAQFLEAKVMPAIYKERPVITISPSSHSDIVKMGLSDPKDVEIIVPGVNVEAAEKTTKTPYPSFLYVGRLKAYKNVDIAIKAFAKVVKTNPTARLTIAGSGELRRELELLTTKLKLRNAVDFLGKVNEAEKQRLLSESWAAVQPSSFEGWGLTVIEANACGTPVIASNVQGLRDSVVPNKTGFLVGKRNTLEFADAMKILINDHQKRAELSSAAKAWSKQFQWEKSAQLFIQRVYVTLDQRYQEAGWPS